MTIQELQKLSKISNEEYEVMTLVESAYAAIRTAARNGYEKTIVFYNNQGHEQVPLIEAAAQRLQADGYELEQIFNGANGYLITASWQKASQGGARDLALLQGGDSTLA